MTAIEVSSLTFTYPATAPLFEQLSFSVPKGSATALIGQNGAGKTTLMKIIAGLHQAQAGNVYLNGTDFTQEATATYAREIAYVFQNPDDQIFHRTVEEEVNFGPKMLQLPVAERERLVARAIKLCHLEGDLAKNPFDLSLSKRKMIALASSLAMGTSIIIMDEPTAGQDGHNLARLAAILADLKEREVTVFMISHDLAFVYEHFASFWVFTGRGAFKRLTLSELISQPEVILNGRIQLPFMHQLATHYQLEKVPDTMSELARKINERMTEDDKWVSETINLQSGKTLSS